jgi:hypothetical protein
LAVIDRPGLPLIISAGDDEALYSWNPDGTPGELQLSRAQIGPIYALAIVDPEGLPLIISAGRSGHLHSRHLDGTPGEVQVSDAHIGPIYALAVVEHEGSQLIISAGDDGALRTWPFTRRLVALERPAARRAEVRELTLGSLEVVVQLPADVLEVAASAAVGVAVMNLSKILDAIKRVAGFPAEVRLSRTKLKAEQLLTERAVLEAQNDLDETRERHRRARQRGRELAAAGWEIEQAVVTDDEDDVL